MTEEEQREAEALASAKAEKKGHRRMARAAAAGQLDTGAQLRVQFKDSPEFQGRVNAIIGQGCIS